jgi:hypothetical protein
MSRYSAPSVARSGENRQAHGDEAIEIDRGLKGRCVEGFEDKYEEEAEGAQSNERKINSWMRTRHEDLLFRSFWG